MSDDQNLNTRIGVEIRKARLSRGITQDDLAKLLDVDRTMISRYERGTRTLSAPALLIIFRYLEYSLQILDEDVPTDRNTGSQTELPRALQPIIMMLQQRPELIPTVEDVLETFLDNESE